jgi:propanediol utilization protein
VITNWNSDNITGTPGIATVKYIKSSIVDKIVNINNILKSSIEHIHLIKRDNIWKFVKAIDVKINDIMVNNLNEEFIVNNVEIINGTFNVYDIDVEDLDLFYGNGVLTHNVKIKEDPN